ncbi:hypothetical protein C5O27_03255 [Gordonia alkanivorans]|uniref:hypothetical protein n=1 Tax=Gordonia alkanivorans TaxID=84096 RepID=UPI000FDDBBB3|nr:hypothetical protein [Gordonia alkanivorans]AZZ80235.1 hypothetical protein C5O27_03255 [Gordonia alkanivorans]
MSPTVTRNQLEFAFPDVHPDARLHIRVYRTLRVPDDETTYGLPPGIGSFSLINAGTVAHRPRTWAGSDVLLPMWQAEAAWFSFNSPEDYPFLVRISVGGINAVTGDDFSDAVDFLGEDYFEVPEQPWLDGFRVDEKTVRQFVAMPLGGGYTAAEQLSGADDGRVRIQVTPLRSSTWNERVAARRVALPLSAPDMMNLCAEAPEATGAMGMGAGGSITQSIATPVEPRTNWDTDATGAAVLRIINSADWEGLTGTAPHHAPPTIEEYLQYGYPWFEWYDDSLARRGGSKLTDLKTVKEIGDSKGESPLPDNPSFDPPAPHIVTA